MRMTWGEILSRASEFAGARTDRTRSDISFWANVAYADVCGRARFRGVEAVAYMSTATGAEAYALPCDFDFEQVVTLSWSNSSQTSPSAGTSSRVLMKRNALQMAQVEWNSQITGAKPYYYEIYGQTMELQPVPDSSYSLKMKYWAKPSTISLEGAYPLIDDRWHMAIVFKTVSYLENARGDVAAARVALGQFDAHVMSIPNDDALRGQSRYGQAASFPREYFGGWSPSQY